MSYTVILKRLLNCLKRMLFLYFRKQKPLKIVIYFPKRKHFLYLRKRRKSLRKNYLYSRKQLSEHDKKKRTHYQRSFFYFRKLNLFAKSLKISFFRRIRYPYGFPSLFTVFSAVFIFCHWFLSLFCWFRFSMSPTLLLFLSGASCIFFALYHKYQGVERAFFTVRNFLHYTPSNNWHNLLLSRLPRSRQSFLEGCRASHWSSKHRLSPQCSAKCISW